jgi:hypothetical protein
VGEPKEKRASLGHMKESFSPDLPLAVVTFIPLILIASATQADVLKYRWDKIAEARTVVKRAWIGTAYTMLLMAVSAEIMALVELKFKTNSLDWPESVFSALVTLGLGAAFERRIRKALLHGEFDEDPASVNRHAPPAGAKRPQS